MSWRIWFSPILHLHTVIGVVEREGDALLCIWRGIGGLNDLRVAGRLTNSLLGFVVSAEGFACK